MDCEEESDGKILRGYTYYKVIFVDMVDNAEKKARGCSMFGHVDTVLMFIEDVVMLYRLMSPQRQLIGYFLSQIVASIPEALESYLSRHLEFCFYTERPMLHTPPALVRVSTVAGKSSYGVR